MLNFDRIDPTCILSRFTLLALALTLAVAAASSPATAKGDDFGAVVKTIEQFYHVKHQNIPLLARAGVKAVTTAAKIKGGDAKRLAEAGSVKVVWFEDQEFDSRGAIASFGSSMKHLLPDWTLLVQTISPKDEEQTYLFLRDTGDKFNVIVATIEKHEAVVVQVTLAPKILAELMQDPEGMSKAITDDATKDNN